MSGGDCCYVDFPELVDAHLLHEQGIDGSGVTVAVVDSGFMPRSELQRLPDGEIEAGPYNAITDRIATCPLDKYGHGSHVASIILNSSSPLDQPERFNSIAPMAQVVAVKAFDKLGSRQPTPTSSAASTGSSPTRTPTASACSTARSRAEPRSHYWDDPLNQAVMALWQAGIVVVASAGNTGPDPMTVGVPGNVPYVITVGAMTDNYTPADGDDDFLASFSSAGPTVEGFVKPDVVAPGGHMTGLTRVKSTLAKTIPSSTTRRSTSSCPAPRRRRPSSPGSSR